MDRAPVKPADRSKVKLVISFEVAAAARLAQDKFRARSLFQALSRRFGIAPTDFRVRRRQIDHPRRARSVGEAKVEERIDPHRILAVQVGSQRGQARLEERSAMLLDQLRQPPGHARHDFASQMRARVTDDCRSAGAIEPADIDGNFRETKPVQAVKRNDGEQFALRTYRAETYVFAAFPTGNRIDQVRSMPQPGFVARVDEGVPCTAIDFAAMPKLKGHNQTSGSRSRKFDHKARENLAPSFARTGSARASGLSRRDRRAAPRPPTGV